MNRKSFLTAGILAGILAIGAMFLAASDAFAQRRVVCRNGVCTIEQGSAANYVYNVPRVRTMRIVVAPDRAPAVQIAPATASPQPAGIVAAPDQVATPATSQKVAASAQEAIVQCNCGNPNCPDGCLPDCPCQVALTAAMAGGAEVVYTVQESDGLHSILRGGPREVRPVRMVARGFFRARPLRRLGGFLFRGRRGC